MKPESQGVSVRYPDELILAVQDDGEIRVTTDDRTVTLTREAFLALIELHSRVTDTAIVCVPGFDDNWLVELSAMQGHLVKDFILRMVLKEDVSDRQ